jgi:DNA-directed RNA polymerase sigma subunit (sigma70/sigma32)
MTNKESLAEYREILSFLTDREASAIPARFGLNNLEPQTLELVGQKFGVTRVWLFWISYDSITTRCQLL